MSGQHAHTLCERAAKITLPIQAFSDQETGCCLERRRPGCPRRSAFLVDHLACFGCVPCAPAPRSLNQAGI